MRRLAGSVSALAILALAPVGLAGAAFANDKLIDRWKKSYGDDVTPGLDATR